MVAGVAVVGAGTAAHNAAQVGRGPARPMELLAARRAAEVLRQGTTCEKASERL